MAKTVYLVGLDEAEFVAFACNRSKTSTRYKNITLGLLAEVYNANISANLRYCRKSHIMRDNNLGVLERPSDAEEWDECSEEQAKHEIMRHVWCEAVRIFNVEALELDSSR